MTLKYCPRCNIRFIVAKHSGDYVHDCSTSTSEALRNEDVPVIGNSDDYTGTQTIMQGDVKFKGMANTLFGTRAWTEGEKESKVTSRGNKQSTHRTRSHLQYIENPDKL
jgi:hypothetical protein